MTRQKNIKKKLNYRMIDIDNIVVMMNKINMTNKIKKINFMNNDKNGRR